MSDPGRRRQRPRVVLCAAITFDAKLDTADPLPPALRQAVAPGADDVFLIEPHLSGHLPPGWDHPARAITPGDLGSLPDDEPSIRRWLCLGGPDLFRALLDAGRVNDLCVLVRPRVDARRDAPTVGGPFTPEFFPSSMPCRLRRMEVLGGECFLHYTVAHRRR